MDRHASQFHSARLSFPNASIIFCCVHIERNISMNLGKKNKLSSVFWSMRKERTSESETKFVKQLKKLKNSKFKIMMINSLEYFLPSMTDKKFHEIGRDRSVDTTNGIESFFHVIKERCPQNIITYIDLFEAIDLTSQTKLINYDYNKLLFEQRLQLLPIIGEIITSLKNECIEKIIIFCNTNNIDLSKSEILDEHKETIKKLITDEDIRKIVEVEQVKTRIIIKPREICDFRFRDDIFASLEKFLGKINSEETIKMVYSFFEYTFELLKKDFSYKLSDLNYSASKKCFEIIFDSLEVNSELSDHIMQNLYELIVVLNNNHDQIPTETFYSDPPKMKNRGGRRETKLSENATCSKKKKQKKQNSPKSTRVCYFCKQSHKSEKCPTKTIKQFQTYLKK